MKSELRELTLDVTWKRATRMAVRARWQILGNGNLEEGIDD